jgi:hypothetical protein
MTKRTEPNRHVMLNLGLMKIRLVSASGLFFLPSANAPFVLAPAYRQAGTRWGFQVQF